MKNILFIIAYRDFRDEEYFIPKSFFEKEGFIIQTASTKKGTAVGKYGGEAIIDLKKEEIDLEKFHSVIFVGGPGTLDFLDNEFFYNIAKKTVEKGKILGAICIAPVILANAGVLQGKDATVWSSSKQKRPISILKEAGALYKEKKVVADGNIVTANGPEAAEEFAKTVTKLLFENN